MSTEQYGQYYWCVKTTTDVSPDGEIYVMADDVLVTGSGALEFLRFDGNTRVNLGIAPGRWLSYFSASLIDGSAVAVEYWAGEVNRHRNAEYNISTPKKERNKMDKSIRYDVLKRDGFKCKICGANGNDSKLHVDHIIPVSKGGKTEMGNLQTLCQKCNAGKSDKQ